MRMPGLLLMFFFAVRASGAEILPADRPIEKAVDHYVNALLKQDKIKPSPLTDDATLVRRLTLDLVGRIPTAGETEAYCSSTDPKKRFQLVDRLMASPGFIRHQVAMFDAMMVPSTSTKGTGNLREYLSKALGENRPWSQIFKELVTPDENDANQKGSGEFLRSRVVDLDRLTNEVSVAFFGVNVSCAQCHDHPLVNDWKQDHFFGMKAFFSRTIDNGGFLAEKEFGQLKFTPNKGTEKLAKPLFLSGKEITLANFREPTGDDTKKEKERLEKAKADKKPAAPPSVSARAKLVEVALQEPNGGFFSRAIVNRLWHRFTGHGLVNPLDQMHSENPPSHPELLEWLARDTASHNYDVKRLIRGIVLSDAYARSSKAPGDTPIPAQYFATARLKPLTPYQMATALKIATVDPASFGKVSGTELDAKLEGLDAAVRGFAANIAMPGDDFQIGVNEALLFSNSSKVFSEFLLDGPGTLLGRAKESTDAVQAIDLLVRSTLCRPATPEEKQLLGQYLTKRSDRPAEACRQIVWALITSSEFRFNH